MATAPNSPTPMPELSGAGGLTNAATTNAQQQANFAALWNNLAYLFGTDGVRANAFNVLASSGGYVSGALSVSGNVSIGGAFGAVGNLSTNGGVGCSYVIVNSNQNGGVQVYERNNAAAVWQMYATSGAWRLWNNTGDKVSVDGSGLLVAQNVAAASDARLKTNVKTLESALATILASRGVSYDRTDYARSGIGVIAQEVQGVLPELVHEDDRGYLSVNYLGFVGVLIEAVKELAGRVIELEKK